MIINKDLCCKCNKCVAECPYKAISKNEEGYYEINTKLCNNCKDTYGNECVKVCPSKAMMLDDGTIPKNDLITRLRPEHFIWIMALINSRGVHDDTKFTVGVMSWELQRKIAANAILDPEFKVRLVMSLDDTCVQCPAKQIPGHLEESAVIDRLCFEELRMEPNTVVKFWDGVKMIEEKFSASFIKDNLTPIPDDIYAAFCGYLSPGAKALQDI